MMNYMQRIIFNRNLIKKNQQQSMTGDTSKSTELRSVLNHQTHQLYERAIAEATIGCQKQSRRMWEEYVVFLKSLKPPGDVRMALENMLKVLCNYAFSIRAIDFEFVVLQQHSDLDIWLLSIRWEFIESTGSTKHFFQVDHFRALLRRAAIAHGRLEILSTLFERSSPPNSFEPLQFFRELQTLCVDVRSKYLHRPGSMVPEELWDRLAERQLNEWWTTAEPNAVECFGPTVNISPSTEQIDAHAAIYKEAVRTVLI